jgi:hypothetical protein
VLVPDPESAAGAGVVVAGVVELVVVVVPGSALGWVVGVVWPVVAVLDESVLAGVVLAGVVLAGVVAGVEVVVAGALDVVSVQPAVPAAATVGVADCPSTVASVWVWVRPGGTLGLALASVLPVVGAVGLAGVLATVLCALAAFGLVGLAFCVCLTTGVWCTTTWAGAGVAGVVGTEVWVGTDATALGVAWWWATWGRAGWSTSTAPAVTSAAAARPAAALVAIAPTLADRKPPPVDPIIAVAPAAAVDPTAAAWPAAPAPEALEPAPAE